MNDESAGVGETMFEPLLDNVSKQFWFSYMVAAVKAAGDPADTLFSVFLVFHCVGSWMVIPFVDDDLCCLFSNQ